ncbi:MAG: hypothetical protein V3T83_16225 [Acidobacteriota bacterium]
MSKDRGFPAWLLYTLCGVVLAVPLPLLFSSRLLVGDGDAWLFVWNMWWFRFALEHGLPLLCGDWIYYPDGACLYLHATVLALTLPSVLLQSFLPLTAISNLFYLLGFILSGVGFYRLARQLGLGEAAALAAGFAFSFSPYHFAHAMGHLNLVSYQWLPFFFCSALRGIQHAWGWRRIACSALWLVLIALTDWYYFIFALMGLSLLTLSPWSFRAGFLKTVRAAAAAVAAALALLLPLLLPTVEMAQTIPEEPASVAASADVLSFLLPGPVSAYDPLFRTWTTAWTAGAAEVGTFVPWSLLLLSLWAFRQLDRPLRWFAAGWLALFGVLSLGPYLQVSGSVFEGVLLPYGWLDQLPLFGIMRAPIRFHLMTYLGLCLLFGYALHLLAERSRHGWKVAGCLGLLLLAETFSWPPQTSSAAASPFFQMLKQSQDQGAVIDLHYGSRALYHQTIHQRKILGQPGMLSRQSRTSLQTLQAEPIRQMLAESTITHFANGWAAPAVDAAGEVVVLARIQGRGRIEVVTPSPHLLWFGTRKLADFDSHRTVFELDAQGAAALFRLSFWFDSSRDLEEGFQIRLDDRPAGAWGGPAGLVVVPEVEIPQAPDQGFSWIFHQHAAEGRLDAEQAVGQLSRLGFEWIVVPYYGTTHYVEKSLQLRPSYEDKWLRAYRIP